MKKRKFAFFLAPNFSMMSLLSMTEPLRASNEIAGQNIYDIGFFAESPVTEAINGMTIATDHELPRLRNFDAVIVCASYNPELSATKRAYAWLRWLHAHGVVLGSADTGAYILARAGLLSDQTVTLHWINLPAFQASFPDVRTSSRLMEFSERFFSCAGATTGIDLMLHLVAKHHGDDFREKVANHFIYMPERDRADREQSALSGLLNRIENPLLQQVLAQMENSGPDRVPISAFAKAAGVSVKRLERIFRHTLDDTPARIYQKIRLQKAQSLLSQTALSVEAVALSCGFASRTQFSRCYKAVFGLSPGTGRRQSRLVSPRNL